MGSTLIFYDPSFPFQGARPHEDFFNQLQGGAELTGAEELGRRLSDGQFDCFVNMHGPYFPKNDWGPIVQFLRKGKALLHVGGKPFRIPCHQEGGSWKMEREQTAYHQQLNIHEILEVSKQPVDHLVADAEHPVLEGLECVFSVEDTCNFILHVSKSSVIEAEMGSMGPMDATIYPLLKGISSRGRDVSAPVVTMDNRGGNYSGGRWVFLNQQLEPGFWSGNGAQALERLICFAGHGVTDFWLKTNYACYEAGEQPRVQFQWQGFKRARTEWNLHFTVQQGTTAILSEKEIISVSNNMETLSFPFRENLQPGLYTITCRAESVAGEVRILQHGFWCMDRNMLGNGEPLTCDRDYFWKDGVPFPIVGMTYMSSDVARYFLFLPNPAVWDRDMERMKKSGINYIRTGVWTAWRNMMLVDGHMDEGVLRAIDAFILCAKKHDLEVTFTFFSFTPEAWEGTNPYLAPRAIEAQKRFISSVVSRHTETVNISWDLINEPSVFDPKRTFSGPRPIHDAFDRRSFQSWLKQRHGTMRTLQENWNVTELELKSFEDVEPPEPAEINFSTRDMLSGKKGLKWLDYTLYSMDMHNRWAEELSRVIKEHAPGQLVTVGQDEALGGQRPSPMFYSESVNYTTNHTWWLMDQLVWDGIFTKSPQKPNLIQETGIMYVENPDNKAKRSEMELRNILERKYAYAFSTGAAGAVQWVWNTNYYMDNVNESNIGAVRADGTEKPEAEISYLFGSFMKENRDLFQGRLLEETAVIFPFSNDFSNRRMAFSATTKLTRTIAYEMKMPFRALSEYHLDSLGDCIPKLMIVPSPHQFQTAAFDRLLETVEKKGCTLLFTGPINIDEYWNTSSRGSNLFGEATVENIVREEVMVLENRSHAVSFGGERIAEAVKEVPKQGNSPSAVKTVQHGKGKVIWCPLPVELNDRTEPILALYEYAFQIADIERDLIWVKGNEPGIYGRKITFEKGRLFIFVSEYAMDIEVEVADPLTHCSYSFIAESERTVMFSCDLTGNIRSIYRPDEVKVVQQIGREKSDTV